ncbi:MAG TPA: hypothetical protein ENK44_03655 [Caldithrix abyssi]|uniref:HMA domain-containing protein n=1 Tax=Caldithrix abyssi TaxID=187145 RepID=A0A7V4U005_CALAY|nr:hypothetical protein [Caldithrix abyssi]
MIDFLIDFARETAFFFNEMAVYLVFGFLMAGILHIIFPDSFIYRHLGRSSLSSVFKATLAGIPLPLCSCGVIPVAASIRNKGASRGASLAFLTATPQIGTDSFMITYSLIGWIFAAFRIAAAFITAVVSGILANIFTPGRDEKPKPAVQVAEMENSIQDRVRSLLRYVQIELFGSIANYLMIGIFAAGLISVLVPDGFFETYLNNHFLSMLIMLLAATPMYICATASTPIAASLLLKGISPGAALVFLLAGPATNAVTISTVVKTMGKKALVIYIGSISVVSIGLGFLLNELAFSYNVDVMMQHQHELLPPWLEWLGSALLLSMLLFHYGRKLYQKIKSKDIAEVPYMALKQLDVKGMTCDHCAMTVKRTVSAITGSDDVQVDLSNGRVTFDYDSDNLDEVKQAIVEKGYEVVG